MTPRVARVLAWGIWAAAVIAILAAWRLATLYPFTSAQEAYDPVGELVWSASWIGFGLVGALIVSQRPTNRIGWVLVGITGSIAIAILAPSYARAAFANPAAGLPLGRVATWMAMWAFYPAVGLVLALLLLFPSGSIEGRGRRALVATLAFFVLASSVVEAVTPGPAEGDGPPMNPLGMARLKGTLDVAADWLGYALICVSLVALADFTYRFWRSRGTQRQQFRWLVLAAASFPALFLLAISLESSLMDSDGFDPVVLVFFLCGNGLAAAIGIAVTRYGLYEINRVISRAVSYVILTAFLVALYLGGVGLLTAITTQWTQNSPVAVAAATLLAAAAFGPARRRIQSAVDRRFNRARYDASLTVEAYRLRLREEVDLDALSRDLLMTVRSSMQPAGAAVWLRGSE